MLSQIELDSTRSDGTSGENKAEKDKMELKATEMMNEDQLEAAKIENDIADRQAKFDLEAIKQENENRKAEDLAARERMSQTTRQLNYSGC